MKRYIEPLCWTVGFLVLLVWVLVATEVKEETGNVIATKAVAEVEAKHAADEPAKVAHVEVEEKQVEAKEKHAEEKPAKAEEKPAKAEENPAKAEENPAKAEEKPAKAEVKHAKAEEKPAKAEEKPVEAKEEAATEESAPAGSGEVADIIAMNNPNYKKHKKGICDFTHKKHAEEYKDAAGNAMTCGSCHHDKDGKPLADLKMGDPVQNCIACHKKPAKGKAKKGEKLSREQKLEFHADAVHMNCIDCHKDYNKKFKTKAAPASCKGCHPKKK